MRIFSLAFLLGVLLLMQFKFLPEKIWLIPILLSALICMKFKKLKNFSGVFFGIAWTLWFAHHQMGWTLPNDMEGKNILATGYITSIPAESNQGFSFLFSLKKILFEEKENPAQGLIKLSWRQQNLNLHPGEKWQLTVRLKKIHGTMNPGSFDYEAWALQEGIRAQGYVVTSGQATLLSNHWNRNTLTRVRELVKNKIEKLLPKSDTSPWIVALTIGERQNIDAKNWEVLRNTGTNHLMAIAGLHIGFAASFFYFLISWIWRRSYFLMLRMPAQLAGAIAGLTTAFCYSALSGFSLPSQRACLMLSFFIVIMLMRRTVLTWQALSAALLIVLLINPLSVLSESFWLSFSAVALIIYGTSARLSPQGLWWKWGRIQWVMALGLIPLGLWLFQQCSLVSFAANSIAIPWVGFLVIPFCLSGCFALFFSEKIGGFLLLAADKSLSVLWKILLFFSQLHFGNWYHAVPTVWFVMIASLGVVLLLLPAGFPGRYVGIIFLLPIFLNKTPSLKSGEVALNLLDVGQGLATVVQTQNHILIFDAGPKLSDNFDMGESVVVPFLRTLNVNKVDRIVISHGDNDHIGGVYSIIKRFAVGDIKTSVPEKIPHSDYCLRGEKWEWDKVKFEFLYPTHDQLGLDNNSSCVLRISTGKQAILFTGDIEKLAEHELVKNNYQELAADIIVAPHHGSKTSAENNFLQAVHPSMVLFPVGYRNRYHFPNDSVVEKYKELGAKQFDTVNNGAIRIVLNGRGEDLSLYRIENRRFWN